MSRGGGGASKRGRGLLTVRAPARGRPLAEGRSGAHAPCPPAARFIGVGAGGPGAGMVRLLELLVLLRAVRPLPTPTSAPGNGECRRPRLPPSSPHVGSLRTPFALIGRRRSRLSRSHWPALSRAHPAFPVAGFRSAPLTAPRPAGSLAQCSPEQFHCSEPRDPQTDCYPLEWLCDGHPDCDDGRDEWGCGASGSPAVPTAGGTGTGGPAGGGLRSGSGGGWEPLREGSDRYPRCGVSRAGRCSPRCSGWTRGRTSCGEVRSPGTNRPQRRGAPLLRDPRIPPGCSAVRPLPRGVGVGRLRRSVPAVRCVLPAVIKLSCSGTAL